MSLSRLQRAGDHNRIIARRHSICKNVSWTDAEKFLTRACIVLHRFLGFALWIAWSEPNLQTVGHVGYVVVSAADVRVLSLAA
jgi:hypothetical protein